MITEKFQQLSAKEFEKSNTPNTPNTLSSPFLLAIIQKQEDLNILFSFMMVTDYHTYF